jgi:hypothetical protein
MFHTNLHVAVTGEQTGGILEPSKKQCFFGTRVALDKKVEILTEEWRVMLAVLFFGENLPSLVCDQ